MFARILVPLDGSPLAEAILPEVVKLARQHRSEVALLRVTLAHTFPGVDQTDAQVHVVEDAEGYLVGVERRLADQGIAVSHVVRYGRAAEEILDHAHAGGAELIAMSTHGRSGVQRWMLGSVAEKVVRHSTVPVLLLRAKALAPAEMEPRTHELSPAALPKMAGLPTPTIRHVLCPVDFSQRSDQAMKHGADLAQRFGAELTVLHVVYDPLDITCSHIPHPPLEQLREEMIQAAKQTLKDRVRRILRGVPVPRIAVTAGAPYLQIIHYAREHRADLIVIGTQGLSGLDHLIMGSTAERVVRHAPCPVLSLRVAT